MFHSLFDMFEYIRDVIEIKKQIRSNNYNFKNAPKWVQRKRAFVIELIQTNVDNFEFILPKYKKDEEIVKIALFKDPSKIQYCDKEIRNNKKIMEILIKQSPHTYLFSSNELKKDITFTKLALKNSSSCASYIPKEYLLEEEFVIHLLPYLELKYIPNDLFLKKSFLLRAIPLTNQIYHKIPCNNFELRNDKDIRLECLKFLFDFTKIPNWECKDEKTIIELVILNNPIQNSEAIYFASDSVKNDKNYLIHLAKISPSIIKYISTDIDVITAAIQTDPNIIKGFPNSLLSNKDIALAAVSKCGKLIRYFNYPIYNDIDVIKKAIENDVEVYDSLSSTHRDDKSIALHAISHGISLLYLKHSLLIHDLDIALALVKASNGIVLHSKWFSNRFKSDLDFAKIVFWQTDYQGNYFDEEIRFEALCQRKKSARK